MSSPSEQGHQPRRRRGAEVQARLWVSLGSGAPPFSLEPASLSCEGPPTPSRPAHQQLCQGPSAEVTAEAGVGGGCPLRVAELGTVPCPAPGLPASNNAAILRGQPVIHTQVSFLSFHLVWGGAYSSFPQLDTHYPMTDAVCDPPKGQGAPSNLPLLLLSIG